MAPTVTFKLNAMIAESVVASKIRLKQALTSIPRFNAISPVSTLKDALDALKENQQQYDIVFVAQTYSKEESAAFIKAAKAMSVAQDAAFVLLLKSSQDGNMAGAMAVGFDGMLAEPYSVDLLNDICELALKVKGERGVAREQAVMGLMVSEVSKQLDAVAILKTCGYETARGMDKFKEACRNFKHLSDDTLKTYENVAEKVFGSAEPAKAPERRYAGVSKRIKTKQVAKIIG